MASAMPGVRLTKTGRPPSFRIPYAAARAVPPAPRITNLPPLICVFSFSAAISPSQSVLWPIRAAAIVHDRVDRPHRGCVRVDVVKIPMTAVLKGIVTDAPRMFIARMPDTALAGSAMQKAL